MIRLAQQFLEHYFSLFRPLFSILPNIAINANPEILVYRSNSAVRKAWLLYFKKHRDLPNISFINPWRFTALHISAVCGTWWVAELLLRENKKHIDVEDSYGLTPLHWAVHLGNGSTANVLLRKGADPKNRGGIPDYINGPRSGTPLNLAVSYNNVSMTKLLLSHEADIDYPDHQSKTPLVWAIIKDHSDIARLLLERGSDPIIPDTDGKTPLHIASALGNVTITKLLLKAGASPNVKDDNNNSPGQEAAVRGFTRVTALLDKFSGSREDTSKASKFQFHENLVGKVGN